MSEETSNYIETKTKSEKQLKVKDSTVNHIPIFCRTHILYYTILYTILYYTILFYTILYYTLLNYTKLYYTILYYIILCYTILCYAILYYTILHYTILQVSISFDSKDKCRHLSLAAGFVSI